MDIKIKINCDNAAFEGTNCGTEIADILHKLAYKLHSYRAADLYELTLMDSNGNSVGTMKVSKDEA